MLTRIAQDAERALEAVEQAEGLLDDERVAAAHGLLRELIGQDFEIDQGGVPRLYRGTRQGRIISTVDPEMRHGRKSSQQLFDGYKLSAAATNSSEPLIIAVHVCPAGETDGPQAKHLIDSQPPGRQPDRILGDTAYGNGPVRAELAERQVDVLAPVPEGKVEEDRLGKREFHVDMTAGTVTCPDGHTVPISISKTGFRGANFTTAMCRGCPIEGAVLPRQVPTPDPTDRTRRAAPSRTTRAPRPEHQRASATNPTTDRTAPRPARAPLRRPQESLHRQREGTIAGRVGGRAGQPQPDRPPPRRPNRLGSAVGPIQHPPNRTHNPAISPRSPTSALQTSNPRGKPTPQTSLLQGPSSVVSR